MIDKSKTPISFLAISITTALLAGCGGGGDSESNTNNTAEPKITVTTDTIEGDEIETITEVEGDDITGDVLPEPNDTKVKEPVDPNVDVNKDDVITEKPVDLSNESAVFERLNLRRTECGFGALAISEQLTNAADNHANYILEMKEKSTQGFQGHYEIQTDDFSGIKNPFYSGKKVENRIDQVGQMGSQAKPVEYQYRIVGENLSYKTFNQSFADKYSDRQIALQGINGLFAAPYHLASLVNPSFHQIGISYGRGNSKIPITLSDGTTAPAQGSVLEIVMASPASATLKQPSKVVSYPCNGITETAYELRNEVPNPFKGTTRDLAKSPIGQPVYILGNGDIEVTNYRMTDAANQAIPLKQLNATNDPNNMLQSNEVILMPLNALKPNQMYKVAYNVSVDGQAPQTKTFSFKTKAS